MTIGQLVFYSMQWREASHSFHVNQRDILTLIAFMQKIPVASVYGNQQIINFKLIKYITYLEKLFNQYPLALITKKNVFYGLALDVEKDVFIARPCTELLVKEAIQQCFKWFRKVKKPMIVFELGTGSGAISIALKKHCQDKVIIYASDISDKALHLAKNNAIKNKTEINFLQGDGCEPFKKLTVKCNLFISNPPYLNSQKKYHASLLKHNPQTALFAKKKGTFYYKKIASQLPKVSKKNVIVGLEIAPQQRLCIIKLFKKQSFVKDLTFRRDASNHVTACWINLL